MLRVLCFFVFLWSPYLRGESFHQLTQKFKSHDLVQSQLDRAKAMAEKARELGSWGDPTLKVAAVNLPASSLSYDESMMTGKQYSLSQKLSLSGKYGKLENYGSELASSESAQAKQLYRDFIKLLWEIGIDKKKLLKQKKILEENDSWLEGMLSITNKLYANGKVPQQALLDIQMRKSELSSEIKKTDYGLKNLFHYLNQLLALDTKIDLDENSLPWKYLDSWPRAEDEFDYRQKVFEHQYRANNYQSQAYSRNFFPDMTLGFSYTERNDLDGVGDFVGVSLAIPFPSSSKRYAQKEEASMKKAAAEKELRHYKKRKESQLKRIQSDIEDLESRLKILEKETLRYAKSSRDVTAKSYQLGAADYVELLRSELQYQDQRLKQVILVANYQKKKLEYLYLKGSMLYPNEVKK